MVSNCNVRCFDFMVEICIVSNMVDVMLMFVLDVVINDG